MCHATVELKKWGNSLGIIIPKDKIDELGLSEHDIIDIDIMKKEKISGFGIAKGKIPFTRDHAEHEDLW
jgi:antitoxin component of MazEF toxin-antitoxin module